jgi:hypothetical protein
VVEEYTLFGREINYANTLTRRREAYHDTALENQAAAAGNAESGTPSIHQLEEAIRLEQRPPIDAEDRALLVDRVLAGGLSQEAYAAGDYRPNYSWARSQGAFRIRQEAHLAEIICSFGEPAGEVSLEKRFGFEPDGSFWVSYRWQPALGQADDFFASELSLFAPLDLRTEPTAETWSYPIETVAKSERGLDRTYQGQSVTLRWPLNLGSASVYLSPPQDENLAPEAHSALGRGATIG